MSEAARRAVVKKYALNFGRDVWNRQPYDKEFTLEYHPL